MKKIIMRLCVLVLLLAACGGTEPVRAQEENPKISVTQIKNFDSEYETVYRLEDSTDFATVHICYIVVSTHSASGMSISCPQ